jgi:predicted membrane-bound mannosyltransferase
MAGVYYTINGRGRYGFDVHLGRFITFYTLIITAIYSIIPYKTPWNLLSFYHGMIILAGIGIAGIIKNIKSTYGRRWIALFIAFGCLHLLWQAYQANYRYHEAPVNPYVYAHPLSGVKQIAQSLDEYAAVAESGKNMRIDVICPLSEVWPLWWYLRDYPNFGFWTEVVDTIPPARLILATPEFEQDLLHKFYAVPPPGQRHLYLPLYRDHYFIRPGIEMYGYVRKDLWDIRHHR